MPRRERRTSGNRSHSANLASFTLALGATAHFDPALLVTDDGTTFTWVDRIAGYSCASTSAGTRPSWSAASNDLGGRPAVSFSAASSQKLITANATLAELFDGNQPFTVFIVRKNATNSGFQAVASFGHTSNDHYNVFANLGSGQLFCGRKGPDGTSVSGTVQPTTTACYDTFVWSGTNFTGYTNSTLSVAASDGGGAAQSPTIDRFAIGSFFSSGGHTNYFDGTLGDIIMFGSALSEANILVLEGLIARKYGW